MVNSISILGSTGSIGRQTVSIAKRLGIRVLALAANSNIRLLEEQARLLKPEFAAVRDEAAADRLRIDLADTDVKVGGGEAAIIKAASIDGAEAVVTALSGSAGLMPTLAAADRGLRIALANKETLVCAGELVMKRADERKAEIIPVDSEHSAIFQCLAGRNAEKELRRIWLTASGGPFRGMTREETKTVTPDMAVSHPNWNMGAKISVDSATMMNKGLELIEAMHLFSCAPERIKILIHPQSIIHSMTELVDGAVIAQLGTPDMSIPIQYALTFPDRCESEVKAPDFKTPLTFEEPDTEKTPCLKLAYDAAQTGGTAPAILSAANEAAVSLFLRGFIGFNDIYDCVAEALQRTEIKNAPDISDILEADAASRETVMKRIKT
ncbi:MAG: 1-deoxy-D-xylulose-5-phosphate reductoisomerase [Oscillospiraceae bacterium]|nr:1-deoxy-D-xylulose-5-phosphate reductoisomerase [Oscillospiraceae bacterium]